MGQHPSRDVHKSTHNHPKPDNASAEKTTIPDSKNNDNTGHGQATEQVTKVILAVDEMSETTEKGSSTVEKGSSTVEKGSISSRGYKKTRPPVLRQQSCPSVIHARQRKESPVPSMHHRPSMHHGIPCLHSPGSARALGPSTLQKMFHRQSSTKVCPDDLGEDCTTSGSRSSSPTDVRKTNMFLFSGTMSPVPNKEVQEEEGFLTTTQLYNSLTDGQLSPYKFDPTFMLIIDTRAYEDYEKLHIVTAHHVGVLADEEVIEPLETYTMVILFDHKGLSHTLRDSILSRTQKRLQRQGFNPFLLRGGFDAFHKKHPYLCTWQVVTTGYERQKLIGNYPSIIVEDELYLGRADQATNLQIVKDLNLTHIINVTQENPHAFSHSHIKYLKINAVDDQHAELLNEFTRAIEFIAKAVGEGGRLLVHCNLGVSRSSTILIAYLMFTRRWLLKDAYVFLRERRPIVRPNRNFIKQLLHFEEMLFGSKFTDIYQWYSPDSDAE